MSTQQPVPEPVTHTPMWTLDEVCQKLHATPRMVHAWRRTGTAPKAYKIGNHLMFEEADVRAWLDARASIAAGDVERRADESGW